MAETQPAVERELSDGGATAEVVLGAPPSVCSRWGQIFGESVAMGTGRFGKGEPTGGGLEMQSQSPPPGCCCHDNTNSPRQGQAGWVTDGRVGGRVGPAVMGAGGGGRVLKHQLLVLRTA